METIIPTSFVTSETTCFKRHDNLSQDDSKLSIDIEREDLKSGCKSDNEDSDEQISKIKKDFEKGGKNKKKSKFILIPIVGIMIIVVISILSNAFTNKMSYTELIQNIEENNVSIVKMKNDKQSVIVILKDNNKAKITVKIPDSGAFIEYVQPKVALNEFELIVSEPSLTQILAPLIPNILLLVGIIIIVSSTLYKIFKEKDIMAGFSKNMAKLFNTKTQYKTTFKDVAGLIEEKVELQEIVDFLKNPKKYKDLGARIPRGLLLVGGPGTGKTLLARAVSGEAEVPFFSISGSEFVEMLVGVGASRVRKLFTEAKKSAPCIVFIDEIDAVGRKRGAGVGGGHDEKEQTLNQLLVEMDGFENHENVIVIAATNRPDILDEALTRPGRFDRKIVVHNPDIGEREEIITLYSKNKPFVEGIKYKVIAKNTVGFSGADLENMVNESALLAARKNKKKISMDDIEEAMVKVMMGPEKHSRIISETERKLTAYHEAGHAIVSKVLSKQDKVHQISIVPRGMAGGYTNFKSNEEKSYRSRSEMQDYIAILLGGRVAEKLVLNDISTGASNDIERVSKIARSMVMKYGMSEKLGPITFGVEQEEVFLGRNINDQRNFSEKIAEQIDDEIKKIIDNAYNLAGSILNCNLGKLHKISNILLEKEKMGAEEFNSIFVK